MVEVVPGGAVPEHGVNGGEQFSHAGHHGDLPRLSGSDKSFVEGLYGWIVDSGAHGSHVESSPDVSPSSRDAPSAPVGSAVSVKWCYSHKGGYLPSIEASQFGKSAHQGERGDLAHAGNVPEQLHLCIPAFAALDQIVYLRVEVLEFLPQELDVSVKPRVDRLEGALETIGLCGPHGDELPSTGHKSLEVFGLSVR